MTQQLELGCVGVLILIHHNDAESAVHVLTNELILLHQFNRKHNQVPKVNVASFLQSLLIGLVGSGKNLGGIDGVQLWGIWLPAIILCTGNFSCQSLCFLSIQLGHGLMHQSGRILIVVDGKILVDSRLVRILTKEPGAKGMEGSQAGVNRTWL